MDEYKEPGGLVLTLFDRLIDRIKSSRPINTNGQPLTTGFVYSQLVLGMPCDPRDYRDPWSPVSGGTIQDDPVARVPAPAADAAGGAVAVAAPPAIDPQLKAAIISAWKTSRLVDTMIMVTNDDSYLEYPGDRHISFAYEGVLASMQSLPLPETAPAVQQRIDEATKVLYELNSDGSMSKTPRFRIYQENAAAYATAKQELADANLRFLSDPTRAAAAPMLLAPYRQRLRAAYDELKAAGADKIERALATQQSVGISIQNHMIAKARERLDLWNLDLVGLGDRTLYSYISPTGWCDPRVNNIGWQELTVEHSEYQSRRESHTWSTVRNQFEAQQRTDFGGGGVSVFGFGAHAKGGSSKASWSNSFDAKNGNTYSFHNDAKNLSISIEYMICTIHRPWLLGDLFYLRNWYSVGNKKNAISDGTVHGQLLDARPLLPMIPVQFLAIRNVKIHATRSDWGLDGQALQQFHTDSQASSESMFMEAGGGFSLGPISIGGGGGHSEGHTQSSLAARRSDDSSETMGWSFDGETLRIHGTQIIAWLSEIVPPCAPLDDPATISPQ